MAAGYRDKDTDSRLAGDNDILTNQEDDVHRIITIRLKDGKVEDNVGSGYYYDDWRLNDGYGQPNSSNEPTNHFLIYCCYRKQFMERADGRDRMLRGANDN